MVCASASSLRSLKESYETPVSRIRLQGVGAVAAAGRATQETTAFLRTQRAVERQSYGVWQHHEQVCEKIVGLPRYKTDVN